MVLVWPYPTLTRCGLVGPWVLWVTHITQNMLAKMLASGPLTSSHHPPTVAPGEGEQEAVVAEGRKGFWLPLNYPAPNSEGVGIPCSLGWAGGNPI